MCDKAAAESWKLLNTCVKPNAGPHYDTKFDTPFHPLGGSSASGSASMHTEMIYVHCNIQSRILIHIRLYISERHFCTPIFIIGMY